MSKTNPHLTTSKTQKRPFRIVVAGYGPVGRCVVEELSCADVQVTIIELNLDTIKNQMRLDRHDVVYGDVTDLQTLRNAKIEQADALIITVPDENVALEACRMAREVSPDIFIAVRTNFLSKGIQASCAGADEVIVEELVTARAMREAVIRRLAREEKS